MSRTWTTYVTVALAGVAVAATAGCAGQATPTATVTQTVVPTAESSAEATPTETATATASPSPDPTAVTTLPGGNGMALPLMLDDSFLPAGWNRTEPRDSGGFRMTVCGVDLEPAPPIDAAAARWQQTPTGPWLEQHVRVYDDPTARNVLAALKEALPGCERYTATDEAGGSTTFDVTRLTLDSAGSNTVTWRQRLVPESSPSASETPSTSATPSASAAPPASATPSARGTAAPSEAASPSTQATRPALTQDVAVARIGSSTVMLVGYAVDQTPPVALLDAALSAAQARG